MRKGKQLLLGVLLFALAVCGMDVIPVTDAAAAAYSELSFYSGEIHKDVIKSGKYYLKDNNGVLSVSTKKTSGYVKTSVPSYGTFSNGTSAYYLKNAVLYKYTFSNKKVSKVKSLKSLLHEREYEVETPYLQLSKIYKGRIYITRGSFEDWQYNTYSYDLKTKKLTLVKKDCMISESDGKYCICDLAFRTDVSPYPVGIYKITSDGKLKLVKKLGDRCLDAKIVDGKVYFVRYADDMMKKASLYRCEYDGTGLKKLGTFTASGEFGAVFVQKITPTYCEYTTMDTDGNNKTKRYYYKK